MPNKKHTVLSLAKKYEDDNFNENVIKTTLFKKAKGFVLEEISEEYLKDDDGAMILSKRKITTKEVAPDINAIKVLIELNNFNNSTNYQNMTDEELLEEKNRLLKLLEGINNEDD